MRWASTRLPGKLLATLWGAPVWTWAWQAAVRAGVGDVIVAVDDPRLAASASRWGASWCATSPDCATGTDRVAEVACGLEVDWVIGLQADEPLADVGAVRAMAAALAAGAPMVTAASPLQPEDAGRLSAVHIGVAHGRATGFARGAPPPAGSPRHHVGMYGWQRGVLLDVASRPPTAAERALGLEQLRALEAGIALHVVEVGARHRGVDTRDDLETLRGEAPPIRRPVRR